MLYDQEFETSGRASSFSLSHGGPQRRAPWFCEATVATSPANTTIDRWISVTRRGIGSTVARIL